MSSTKPVSKTTTTMIGHCASQGNVMANLTPFIPVLMLITRVIHQSTLHFAVAGCIVYQSII